ncbi:caspase family protein, partial [Mesorhizobium sp.]|uniref:caspase family protein n=1 Tax=Mesorhizobium sp. TaxID=1871066 RepID=UPI0025DE34D4
MSANGRLLASLNYSGTIDVWDVQTGRLIRNLPHSGDGYSPIVFTEDATELVSSSPGAMDAQEGELVVWNAETGEIKGNVAGLTGHPWHFTASRRGDHILSTNFNLRQLDIIDVKRGVVVASPDHFNIAQQSYGISSDGDRAAIVARGGNVAIYNLADGKGLYSVELPGDAVSVAFSPDGKLFAAAGGEAVRVYDSRGGKPLKKTIPGCRAHSVAVTDKAHSIAFGCSDGALKIWDGSPKTKPHSLTVSANNAGVNLLAFSPDGARLLSSRSDAKWTFWDVKSGQQQSAFQGVSSREPGGVDRRTAYSRDLTVLATVTSDRKIKIFDTLTGKLLRELGTHGTISKVFASSNDDQFITSGQDARLRTWDLESGRQISDFPNAVNSGVSNDGTMIATIDPEGRAKITDVRTGVATQQLSAGAAKITSAAFSLDSTKVVTTCDDKSVRVFSVKSGEESKEFQYKGYTDPAYARFSPDGMRILVAGNSGLLRLLNASNGETLLTYKGHTAEVSGVAFLPDGSGIITGSYDRTIMSWTFDSDRPSRVLPPRERQIEAVAVAPDGLTVASAGGNSIELWNIAGNAPIRVLSGHRSFVVSIAFISKGTRIASSSRDGTVKIWDVATGSLVATFIPFTGDEWISITPEGFFVSSEKGGQFLNIVRGFETYSIDQAYQSLYRPDLVLEKLAGDREQLVAKAAAKLDLTAVLTSGLTPKVEITIPDQIAITADGSIELEAFVTDRGGGVGKVEWKINGVTTGIDQPAGLGKKPLVLKRTLALTAGANNIEVTAYNFSDLLASDTATVLVDWKAPTQTQAKLFIMAIGVNDYWDSRLRLSYAVPDAKAIAEAFEKGGESLYGGVDVTLVLDEDVNRENLERLFSDLSTRVAPQDVFMFFAAGHGITVDGRYYYLPRDFKYEGEDSIVRKGIDQDQFQSWFAKIPALKSVLMYDTCESGSLTGDRIMQRGMERVAALDRLTRAMG